jgi:abequosyltransferase
MNNRPLISIAIPTYNRATCLAGLLGCIAIQANELKGLVEICVSNNCSTDNTREIVTSFQKKYSGLISYNENKENLGADRNYLKVMEMSRGDFIWLLGDDDMIVDNGIKKVITLINRYCDENTGVIMLRYQDCFTNSATGEKKIFVDTTEKNKPQIYEIDLKDIIGINLGNSFISTLLLNNYFTKKILSEERQIIKEATGNYYVHTFLYQLMLLKYSQLKAIRFNEIIISVDLHYYKFCLEDGFKLYYSAVKKLNDLLASSKYISSYYKKIIISQQKKVKKGIIKEMGVIKAFDPHHYASFSFGCIKLFFRQATLTDAFFLSCSFVVFYITPAFVLRNLYKIFIKIKHKKNWQKVWYDIQLHCADKYKDNRRLATSEDCKIHY